MSSTAFGMNRKIGWCSWFSWRRIRTRMLCETPVCSSCKGGPPWPPLSQCSQRARRAGHGGPPLHELYEQAFQHGRFAGGVMSKLNRTSSISRAVVAITTPVLVLISSTHTHSDGRQWSSEIKPGRSIVRSEHGMVASSQPLASQIGLEVLKRGGNAVDAAIAMAAVLNVTEPMMTGVGGDMFALVYWSKTGELKGLNASGRAPRALNLDYFTRKGIKNMPIKGMEPITVPGAFDGGVTIVEKYGTMKLADLLALGIEYAENGFPVMEKAARDWEGSADKLRKTPAASANYLIDGRAPRAGEIFRQKNLARTLRTLARGGRDAFYKGEITRAIVDYCEKNGGFLSMRDFAEHKSEWVEPIATDYRGYKVYECPPNGQGLTALLALNILEGFDLASMNTRPDLYYHTLIEAMKLAFADRNKYIADPAFAKVPVAQLLSKEYAANRRALINPDHALESPEAGAVPGES